MNCAPVAELHFEEVDAETEQEVGHSSRFLSHTSHSSEAH